MDLTFTEIATTARATLQVARRLAADDDLDAAVPEPLRPRSSSGEQPRWPAPSNSPGRVTGRWRRGPDRTGRV
jgi:hypothetical protein